MPEPLQRAPQARRWILAAVVAGLLVRLPGVLWGTGFPFGWKSHHPDEFTHQVNVELFLNRNLDRGFEPHPYPKALAAHVAIPLLAARAASGRPADWVPTARVTITLGRLVSVLYGAATILVLGLFALLLFQDWRVAAAAAWVMALGGLHVSQSHFFVSDVPALFFFLLGLYFLFQDLAYPDPEGDWRLHAGAACLGAAFALKLFVSGLPSLGLAILLRPNRFRRGAYAAVFFLAAYAGLNLLSYTPNDLADTFAKGISTPGFHFNRWFGALLYLLELPSVVSLPLTLVLLAGAAGLAWKWGWRRDDPRFVPIGIALVLPAVVHALLVVVKLDHFPRHLVTFIPWIALAAGWALVRGSDRLRAAGLPGAVLPAIVIGYLALFVADGERAFFRDPRDQAASWVMANVPRGTPVWWRSHRLPGYPTLRYPDRGRPAVIVMEMLEANHFLSGVDWKGSMPRDYHRVFGERSQQQLDAQQSLFLGTSEYHEVARYAPHYVMPEYTLTDRWLGDRSRNYVTELVIFRSDRAPSGTPEPAQ